MSKLFDSRAAVLELEARERVLGKQIELEKIKPKHEWVGLTDEDIHIVYMTSQPAIANEKVKRIAKAIEAKLKEKNT